MHLTLIGQYGLPETPETALHVAGDTLTVNGRSYDLSDVPEGGEGLWKGESPFDGPIRRIDGTLHLCVVVQFDGTADLNAVARWEIKSASGDIVIPVTRRIEVLA